MAIDDFAGLKKRIDGLASEFNGKAVDERLKKVGELLEPYVDQAVVGDIGDHSMSGWSRKKPMEITGHSELAKSAEHGIFIAAANKASPVKWARALGVMRVLTDGRAAAEAGSFRISGTRIRKKDGAVVDKRRRRKRTVGFMPGKGTWNDAETEISANVGKAVHDALVIDVIKRHIY